MDTLGVKDLKNLREQTLDIIEKKLSPIAMKYQYCETPLEKKVKWKPIVLILGNYSSGKSTLINEFIGANIQRTGQAPTDDSFTIITYDGEDDNENLYAQGEVFEEREGTVLINSDLYPFSGLKPYGDRLSSHLKLKKVKCETLKDMAIIDTPGMLDTISENDRGYPYQEVVGELAELADVILVLFDAHKAGTVRETYTSLRTTLPEKSFEDRVVFVLNRIDECGNLEDMLRVYGTLCWNLSQMTGRKDIPRVLLTYSSKVSDTVEEKPRYLNYLENQQMELKKTILSAPKNRLDHLNAFVDFHTEHLKKLNESFTVFNREKNNFSLKFSSFGFLLTVIATGFFALYTWANEPFGKLTGETLGGLSSIVAFAFFIFWVLTAQKFFFSLFKKRTLERFEDFMSLKNQKQQDLWEKIKPLALETIRKDKNTLSTKILNKERLTLEEIAMKKV